MNYLINILISKINALAEHIEKEINPNAKISGHAFAINGQQSSRHVNDLLEELSISDIIIDCTADSNLIFGINEVVVEHDINYISGSVISGGIGNVLTKGVKALLYQ